MSLSGIFDPVIMAYFGNKSLGSPDTGVVCVAYHVGGEYENADGIYKISNLKPASNSIIVFENYGESASSIPFVGYNMTCTEYDGLFEYSVTGIEEFALAYFPQELSEEYEISPGLYITDLPGGSTFCYILWEEKGA